MIPLFHRRRRLLLPLFGSLLLCFSSFSNGLPKNRVILDLCPNFLYRLCHPSNYTAAYTSYPEDVVKAVSSKFFLNTFGCGPSFGITPKDHKYLLQVSCGKDWSHYRRTIDRLLCDHAALWAGHDMIQRCTINGSKFWGNDECFDLLKDVWMQEQRSIFCSTLQVDRNKSEYRRARSEMKCLGYYPSSKRQAICEDLNLNAGQIIER